MHAIIRYALWIKQHLQGDSNSEVKTAQGFDEIPEVRNLLEYHLDPKHEPSLTIRSVYGHWFPRLMADSIEGDEWFLSCYQEDNRTILSAVLQSEDKKAHKAAKDLINRLLARNYADFRDLLSDGAV
jgi:hypothetical protein